MTTVIKPTGHHLVVKPMPIKEKTDSGIIVAREGSEHAKMQKAGRDIGTILAIGPQAFLAHASALYDYARLTEVAPSKLEAWCKVGDVVYYAKNAGRFLFDPMSGEELYIIHDEDVQAVLPPYDEWKHDIRELRI